jgi:hypothetical protein
MRRPLRLGFVILVVLLVISGAYTVYWFLAARQIKDGLAAWAQSVRAEKLEAAWQSIRVTGFPIAFRVELEKASLREDGLTPSPELRIDALSGTTRPWDFAVWRLAAPTGLTANLAGAGDRLPLKLASQTAAGVVSIGPQGSSDIWLSLQDVSIQAAERVKIGSADIWVILPQTPPQTRADASLEFAFNARQVQLPAAISPLGDTIDELASGLTVKGGLPSGRLAQAVAAWRDAGGVIELDNLRVKWGGLGATATGTIALDKELQPIGGFSGAIQGYDQILTALVQGGHMRAADAGLARLALAVLARAGPDGRPQIATGFTIQNGQMFLGPAKLGKAPHLAWE